jgi:hypothetical protein
MTLKTKIKQFFKTKDSSEHGAELWEKFILPFIKLWDPTKSIDEAVEAFFAVEHRKFYNGVARKNFMIHGKLMRIGGAPTKRYQKKLRAIRKGAKMLIAADKKDQTARVDVEVEGKETTFVLSRAEMEFLKDYVEITEC